MIENKNEASRNLEKALHALEQEKQRVANEKKRKAEKPLPYKPLSPIPKMKTRGKFHLHGLLQRALSVLRQPKGEMTIPLE